MNSNSIILDENHHISNCPKCNNPVSILKSQPSTFGKEYYYSVRCIECNISGSFANSPKEACDNWNRQKFTFHCSDCDNYYAFSYSDNKDTFYIRCLKCGKSTNTFPSISEAIKAWESNDVNYSSKNSNPVIQKGDTNNNIDIIEKSGKKYWVHDNKVFCQIDNMDESISMDKHLAYLRDFAEICIEHCDNPSMVKQYAQIMLDQVNKIQAIRDDAIANYKHPNCHDFNPTLIGLSNVLMEENKFLFLHRRQICPPYMKEYDVEPCGPTDGRSNHTKDRNCHACWHQVFLKMQEARQKNNDISGVSDEG